jgi:hypothetical protein
MKIDKDRFKKFKNGADCARAVLEYLKVTLPMYELEPTFENLEMVLSNTIMTNCMNNKVMPGKEFAVMTLSAGVLEPVIKDYYKSKEDEE